MRELRFRVWNGMEMVYDVTVGKFGVFYVNPGDKGNGLDPKDSASLTPFNTKYHDGTPVMQFTGLLDKNGKEIYERDILKSCEDAKSGLKFHYIVEWGHHAWSIRHYKAKSRSSVVSNYTFHQAAVIGNIYENPELLRL